MTNKLIYITVESGENKDAILSKNKESSWTY